MYVCMYIHHHRGIIPPPIPWGGVGTRDTGPYIYNIIYIYILSKLAFPPCFVVFFPTSMRQLRVKDFSIKESCHTSLNVSFNGENCDCPLDLGFFP